jgi:hypothetical protein
MHEMVMDTGLTGVPNIQLHLLPGAPFVSVTFVEINDITRLS